MGEAHRAKMAAKRRRRATLTAGFTPVPNKRIDSAISTQALVLMQVHQMSAVEAHQQAMRNVAKTLPRPRPFRHLFPRPSKSDSPVYRKAT